MARSTVDDCLNALYVGLPGTVGTSVGVGNLDAKRDTLATKITLCHSLHLLSNTNHKYALKNTRLDIIAELVKKSKSFFQNFFEYENNVDIPRQKRYNSCKLEGKAVISMFDIHSVPLKTLVEEFDLEMLYEATDYPVVCLTVEDVARPGLQLAGYFDHFEPMRLIVMGNMEASYLQKLDETERALIFDRLFSYKFPALLIARNIEPDPQCIEMAKKHNITVLRTAEATSTIVSAIIAYLKSALAPSITRHGVLMEVYGEGVLIVGESGMGKSETAVELVKRGHRLIADDAVEIRKVSGNSLMGKAPALIRNYVELRGIGIINVMKLFGMGAVKAENEINLVVNIVPWNKETAYDRLGLEDQHTEILGVKIPMNTIPVTPGRNLAVILEVAAMNNRQRKMGYNAALEFTQRIDRHFEQNKE